MKDGDQFADDEPRHSRRPQAVKTNLIRLIRDEAPPHPACFDTQQQWVEFLVAAHASGTRVVRREDTGKHSGKRATRFAVLPAGQQSHCAECELRRQERMRAEGRCFPVRAPAQRQPQQRPAASDQEDQKRLGNQFDVQGIATFSIVSAGKRGPEDKRYLVIVLNVELQGIDAGVCAYFDPILPAFLYRQDLGGRVVRNKALKPIAYEHRIQDATVEINRVSFHGADISSFVVHPIDGQRVTLRCRVAIYPGKANCSGLLSSVNEGVRFRITGPASLFDEDDRANAPRQQSLA